MKTVRVAINGFGRIGRAFVRQAYDRSEIEVVAVNDLGSLEDLAYLLKHDTVYGHAPFEVSFEQGSTLLETTLLETDTSRQGMDSTAPAQGGKLLIDGKPVAFLSVKDPGALPWKDLNIDVVVEATGLFTDYEKANAHVTAGARRVVITGPVKDDTFTPDGLPLGATILMGLDESKMATCAITSNASCTTNSASPVIAILDRALGIEKAVLSTTHAYTASQSIVDGPSKKDMKEGRAAAQNIVPTSTGAAIAVTKAYPPLAGKFDGISLRVPVAAGSIADITFIAKRPTTVEEVNSILKAAGDDPHWAGLFKTTDEQLVSSDIIGERCASIADLGMTRVVDGNLVKVLAWYDNEAGYTHTLVEHVVKAGNV